MRPWPRVWCGGPAEPRGPVMFDLAFAVDTRNEANGSAARFAKVRRREEARDTTRDEIAVALGRGQALPPGPWCVRITRISPSRLDDDAVPLACKSIRDTLAAVLGVDDGSDAVAFCYAQEKGKPLGVRIEVWGASGAPS